MVPQRPQQLYLFITTQTDRGGASLNYQLGDINVHDATSRALAASLEATRQVILASV